MIRFIVVTHEMEERFILKNVSTMDTKESFLFRIFIEFQVLKSCDNGPLLLCSSSIVLRVLSQP